MNLMINIFKHNNSLCNYISILFEKKNQLSGNFRGVGAKSIFENDYADYAELDNNYDSYIVLLFDYLFSVKYLP